MGISSRVGDLVGQIYEKALMNEISQNKVPNHIGIITDGNRRYAMALGISTDEGHVAGKNKLEDVLDWCREIINAVRKILKDGMEGKITPSDISEAKFREYLYDGNIPDPDLILRTSGEERVSNFLIWQSAYSELYFTDVYWPDFRKVDFLRAIKSYQMRKRRFGE